MRNQEWDCASAQLHSLDFSQLVFGFLRGDPMDGEAALGVVDEPEILPGFLN